MPKKPKKRVLYRDKKTGKLVSKATWTRSRTHGGTRYVRKASATKKRSKRAVRRPIPRHKASRKRVTGKRVRKVKRKRKAPRKRLQRHEYQINVKYIPKEGAKVEVQIAAFGPPGQTREQVITAVDYYLDEGENMEDDEGNIVWEVHIRFWERYGRQSFGDDESARMHLKFFVGDADLEVTNKTTGKTL